jgi:polysaccharide pyruvyl transferase WcaK-like protein
VYRWPYYHSSSPGRRRASSVLAKGYARLADRIVDTHGHPVALIAMEELDEGFCRRVAGEMRRSDRARVFSSREHDASRMTWLLRSLRLLTTSRYHAAILSLAAQVPQIAVGHDLRLSSLYDELGLQEEFFLRPTSPAVFRDLEQRIDQLMADPKYEAAALSNGYREHLDRAQRNRILLDSFFTEHGWRRAEPWAA